MKKEKFLTRYNKEFNQHILNKIVFKMGISDNAERRITEVTEKFEKIAETAFQKDFWVVLMVWDLDRGTFEKLNNNGFHTELAHEIIKGTNDDGILEQEFTKNDEVLYLNYKKYSFETIKPLVRAIAGYELGSDFGVNISCYFVCFAPLPVFINLYDDRGMELLCSSNEFYLKIKDEFKSFLS